MQMESLIFKKNRKKKKKIKFNKYQNLIKKINKKLKPKIYLFLEILKKKNHYKKQIILKKNNYKIIIIKFMQKMFKNYKNKFRIINFFKQKTKLYNPNKLMNQFLFNKLLIKLIF